MFVHTCLFDIFYTLLVRRLLDVLVNIGSTHELLGTVPHGQPCGRVVKENTVVTSPYHTPKMERHRKEDVFSVLFWYRRVKKERHLLNIPRSSWDWVGGYGPGFLCCSFLLGHFFFFKLLDKIVNQKSILIATFKNCRSFSCFSLERLLGFNRTSTSLQSLIIITLEYMLEE